MSDTTEPALDAGKTALTKVQKRILDTKIKKLSTERK